MIRKASWLFSSWASAAVLCLPLLALGAGALNMTPDGGVFSQLATHVLGDYLLNTGQLIAGVVALSLLFGVPTAWLVAMYPVPGRRFLQWALMLPMAMPSYLIAYLYTDLLDYSGAVQHGLRWLFDWHSPSDYWFFSIRSLGGASWMLALVLFPYVFLLARAAFLEQSTTLLQGARLLGYAPWRIFWRLSLPMARPTLMLAASLVAMETLADFATVHYFAVNTLTTAVYDAWLGYGSLASASRLSCLMLALVMLLLALERFSRRRQRAFQKNMGHETPLLFPLRSWQRYLAGLWCWGLVFFGFGLPFILLSAMGVMYFEDSWTDNFMTFANNSLGLSGVTALLAMLLALLFGFCHRWEGTWRSLIPLRLANFGYAIPGTVLAIGVLAPLTALDFWLNDVAIVWAMPEPGLILTGSAVAIVFGYLVRFVAVAMGAIESSLQKIPPSLDMAIQTLGRPVESALWRIHLPLVRRGVIAGGLLVFIECMKELPAALLLRPFNFETLATYVYQFVSDDRLEHAALGAIIIVLVGLLPIIWLNRFFDESAQ